MARVSRCLRGWSAASSGLMTPRRTCSGGHGWAWEMSLTLPLRTRYAGLSPTFTRPSSPPRMATTTMVLPIPSHAGFPVAASNPAELAALHARFRRLRSGPSSPSSASVAVKVLTAIELAVWPAAWPPIPSQTTSSESSPALLRQTTTESSFSSRSRPGSVADADFSRTPLRLYDREAECVLTDCDAVAGAGGRGWRWLPGRDDGGRVVLDRLRRRRDNRALRRGNRRGGRRRWCSRSRRRAPRWG